ncbi:hypothetical protein [Tropicimonas isoalkanivorans]|uniref:DUF3329 domain-containing protein n=1 Tax=Tropicimonas isoalkanivorans TaxID=441112 RepID=A0A1I1HAI1_9RHOB|nr:hypothetical protein [Tropicimonas isoalkanivorans]SFC21007.1 hypothetical protein SAMN04488094_10385 [Tropicimonas isoalkanivorans]
MFDFDIPFFRPLWVRLAVTAIAIGWGLFELASGSVGFAIIFLSAGIYAAYRLFVTFDPTGGEERDGGRD